eukprot:10058987-Ditylum_brightwellii.AAC.3
MGESDKRDIPYSGEMTQYKEEGEEEFPNLINKGGNDEDSDEEFDNEEGMEVEEDERDDSDEALPIEGKGENLAEEIYDEMEKKGEGEHMYEMIVDHRFENGILKLKVNYYNKINGKDNIVEVPFGIMRKD